MTTNLTATTATSTPPSLANTGVILPAMFFVLVQAIVMLPMLEGADAVTAADAAAASSDTAADRPQPQPTVASVVSAVLLPVLAMFAFFALASPGRFPQLAWPSPLTLLAPLVARYVATRRRGAAAVVPAAAAAVVVDVIDTAVLPALLEELTFRECIRPMWVAGVLFGLAHLRPGVAPRAALATMTACGLFHVWMWHIRPANYVAHFWWNLVVLTFATPDDGGGGGGTALTGIETRPSTLIILLVMALLARVNNHG